MGLFDFFRGRSSTNVREELISGLTDYLLDRLSDDRGIRIEDAVSVSATIVGERVIDFADDFPLRDHENAPGQRFLSIRANEIICGDSSKGGWEVVPEESVFGILRQRLHSSRFGADIYPPLNEIFSNYASAVANVSKSGKEPDWGKVPLSVSEDHQPFIFPLQWGFETRGFVDKILQKLDSDKQACLEVATQSLASLLNMVADTADPSLALTIALETVNGMAKTYPMTDAAYKEMRNRNEQS